MTAQHPALLAMTGLAPAEGLALGTFDPAPYRELALGTIGTVPVDFDIHCEGSVTIAPHYEKLFITTVDLQRVIAAALLHAKRGVKLEDLVRTAFRMRASEGFGTQLRELIGRHKEKSPCRGSVQGDLQFRKLAQARRA